MWVQWGNKTVKPESLSMRNFIRKANNMLLPMYAADLEASKTVAANSQMITANVVKRLAHVTDSLNKLQLIVETELKRKRPVFMTSETQTLIESMEMFTAMTPVVSPIMSPINSPRLGPVYSAETVIYVGPSEKEQTPDLNGLPAPASETEEAEQPPLEAGQESGEDNIQTVLNIE